MMIGLLQWQLQRSVRQRCEGWFMIVLVRMKGVEVRCSCNGVMVHRPFEVAAPASFDRRTS